jgi:tetratricopeptide (TPR) repeat protein
MKPTVGQIITAVLTLLIAFGMVGGFIFYTVRNAEDPPKMIIKWVITIPVSILCLAAIPVFGLMGPFIIVFCGVVLSILWTPHIGAFLIRPLTSAFDGGNFPPELRPAYSVAQSRQKQGQYTEAIAEVRRQLDRFPNDFEGHILLAQIQAEGIQDMPGAELTIHRLCAQLGHAPKNIAFALYSLADWHLKYGQDREAARRAFEKVIELLPETEFAAVAAQRIAHLGSPDMLLAPHERKKFAVPEGVKNVGLKLIQPNVAPPERDPGLVAQEYVRHLEEHPLDTEARERLAVLYAEHYGRLDMASDQLEQLITQPHASGKNVVRWLNLLADLQIRCGAGLETVKQTLERIIERGPDVAAAEIARKRIYLLRLEMKSKQPNESVKLGTYEQNLGLKSRRSAEL